MPCPSDVPFFSPDFNIARSAGISNATQCVQVPFGASGSSHIKTKLFVPTGAPLHESSGEISSPSPVNCLGIMAPLPKDDDVIVNDMFLSPFANTTTNGMTIIDIMTEILIDLIRR